MIRNQNAAVADKARLAVSEFRQLQPTLTAFARNLTGNPKIIVQIGKGAPRTDGKVIYYPPPIELGERLKHVTSLCDKRDWDDTLQMLCPACKVRERIFASIYHEISHVAFDTFLTPDKARIAEAVRYVRAIASPKYADRIARRIAESPDIPRSYMSLAHAINPYFKVLVNSLEDVRINTRMHKARPGTKPMMDAQIMHVMGEGIRAHDGTVKRWTDMHLNHQATIATYLYASGFAPREGWLAPEVIEALKDADLRRVLDFIPECPSVHDIFEVSGVVFMRLRDLGFFKLTEEEEQDAADQQDDEEDEGPSTPPPPTPPQPGAGAPPPPASEPDDEAADDAGEDSGSQQSGGDEEAHEDEADESEEPADGDASDDVAGGSEERPEGGSEPEGDDGEDLDGGPEAGESEGAAAEDADEDAAEEDGAASGDSPDESGDDDDDDESSEGDAGGDPSDLEEDPADDSQPGDGGEPGDDDSDDEGDEGSEAGGSEGGHEPADDEPFDDGEPFRADVEPSEDAEGEDLDLDALGLHAHSDDPSKAEEKAIEVAIVQGEYFEKPSANIEGVNEWHHDNVSSDFMDRPYHAWNPRSMGMSSRRGHGVEEVAEALIAPALMRMRLVFADNKRTQRNRNQKSGRLDARVLGKRAWNDDDRLFGKKIVPAKKDYVVYICIDVSGSTAGKNLQLIKQAAMAKAEMLARMGIPFAIFAHTGSPTKSSGSYGDSDQLSLDIYHIKAVAEPWDDSIKRRLADIGPSYCNLDGHAMEFYRKLIERESATDRIILYYSDGKMPLENFHEELDILQREIRNCKQKRIHLLGVGIRTDSPRQHGLDTVQVDRDADIIKVVEHLERTLVAW